MDEYVGPSSATLENFMTRFTSFYSEISGLIGKIVGSATAHHRLLWLHPFLDGNGRVARLFTDACLIRIPVEEYGIWTISRGLARNRDRYKSKLAFADSIRRGDLDGRGNLSDSGLYAFCVFFLNPRLTKLILCPAFSGLMQYSNASWLTHNTRQALGS